MRDLNSIESKTLNEYFADSNESEMNALDTAKTYLDPDQHDLATPDGVITHLTFLDEKTAEATVAIAHISPHFVGFQIDTNRILFNIKSTLAQLGLNGVGQAYELDLKNRCAYVKVQLQAIGPIAIAMLKLLQVGASIGKLFAADERRLVRDPDYLARMFGRSDRRGRPLLSLGGLQGSNDLVLDKINGRTVAYLTLQNGRVLYDASIYGFLPTIAQALIKGTKMRDILRLHQQWHPFMPTQIEEDEILLVRTLPLHIRTVFAKVVDDLLSPGYHHTTASVLQPNTLESGDIYELFGSSKREITDIPLEFYTLEPYREHVFFSDRDQLQIYLDDEKSLFEAFATAPKPIENRAAVFIVKGQQMKALNETDWIAREPRLHEFPGSAHGTRQALMIERYIEQQPCYPFLKGIDLGTITSQGVLFTRYFPSPLMKRMLLGDQVQRCLKGIYFQYPSLSHQNFFSSEDRALLHDLDKFAIPVFWVDESTHTILQYVQKPERDSGLFVPIHEVDAFLKSTVFGIYGSNLSAGDFEDQLRKLLQGVLDMRDEMNHPLLHKGQPLTLLTGGGPGAMEVGNRIAKELHILSCANIADFRQKDQAVVNEQLQNAYVEAKMTYRLDKLVERQAEFNLDFPIFLWGGIGTDFEYTLEEVRRKVGSVPSNPILLFGDVDYWRKKVTSRFQCNLETGTIKGSEWISNCFYCVQNAEQGLKIYQKFFLGTLPIGRSGPIYKDGFATPEDIKNLS
jgi:predicted Rossmann-fold nucleotide-binding protein